MSSRSRKVHSGCGLRELALHTGGVLVPGKLPAARSKMSSAFIPLLRSALQLPTAVLNNTRSPREQLLPLVNYSGW